MRIDWAPMKKNMTALATRPARTCGVPRKELGSSAMPSRCSTFFSTRTSTARTKRPRATEGSAGEMPKTVNGHPANGSMRPQLETLERPTSTRNRPAAASATPRPSKGSFSLDWATRGRRSESAPTTTKYAASSRKVGRMPAVSMTTPRMSGSTAESPEAAPMHPKATMRLWPRYSSGTSPRTEGTSRLAPSPTSTRPTQMKTAMLGAKARTTSPIPHTSAPVRKVRAQPRMVPSRPPAIMNAPPTSG